MQLRIQWKQGPKPILSQRRTSSCPAWCSTGADPVKLAKGKMEMKSRKTGSWYSAFIQQERPGRLHTSECNHATTMEPADIGVPPSQPMVPRWRMWSVLAHPGDVIYYPGLSSDSQPPNQPKSSAKNSWQRMGNHVLLLTLVDVGCRHQFTTLSRSCLKFTFSRSLACCLRCS